MTASGLTQSDEVTCLLSRQDLSRLWRFAGGSSEASAHTLSALQSNLVLFSFSDYSGNGHEPLQYATVLLLSLSGA